MWSSTRLHSKSHNLSFDKDEQQNKHLEESQELAIAQFELVNKLHVGDKHNQNIKQNTQ